jgi:pilus retraction protein PilT
VIDIDQALRALVACDGSDLHITGGSPPMARINGELEPLRIEGWPDLEAADIDEALRVLLGKGPRLEEFEERHEIDFSREIQGVARFRINARHQRGGILLVARAIPHRIRTIDELALPPVVARLAEEQRGIILVTGTTGSGKSTTLAAMIDYINVNRAASIVTIEDPIEFVHHNKRSMVGQREIGVDTLGFKEALRHVLRQDPDVIMVGEIRDRETADIAIRASLTGHLVFSTLHTNDAPGAITRLVDMGIEPFLVASAIELVIAQRLVRRLCPECNKSQPVAKVRVLESLAILGCNPSEAEGITHLKGPVGCDRCRGTGYRGRIGLFEIFRLNEEMHSLVLKRESTRTLALAAREQGMRTLGQSGWEKVKSGFTTLEEVLRVITISEQ